MKYLFRMITRLILLFVLSTAVFAADINTPQKKDPAAKPTSRIWNLQDADILSVINEVSLETGKNFIVDPRVHGKITLVSSRPIKANQVYDVFLSVLGQILTTGALFRHLFLSLLARVRGKWKARRLH